MRARNRTHDKEPQPRSLDLGKGPPGDAVETLENALQLVGRNAHSAIADAELEILFIGDRHLDSDVHCPARILDGVVEHVRDGRAQLRCVAAHDRSAAVHRFDIFEGVDAQVVARARNFDAFLRQRSEIYVAANGCLRLVRNLSGLQYLIDRFEETVGVAQHEPVKILALRLVYVTSLQRLEIQPDRRDGRFQFVCDSVDETVVLLVAAQLANQEARVENHSQDDPADVQRNGQRYQAYAEDDKERDRLSPARDSHGGNSGL